MPIIYFGKHGVYGEYADAPGGGNCANFVSMAMLAGGAEPSDIWGLYRDNDPSDPTAYETRHKDHRTNPLPETEYLAGITLPDGARPFTGVADMYNYLLAHTYYNSPEVLSPSFSTTFYLNYNNPGTNFAEDNEVAFNSLGVGDLIISKDTAPAGYKDHVSLVVGWGASDGEAGSPFYSTREEAAANGITDPVPYAIDHGGSSDLDYVNPATARPWTQTVTSNQYVAQEGQSPDVYISFANIEPSGE